LRFGKGPKERRLTPAEPEVLSRGTWDFVVVELRLLRKSVVEVSARRGLVGVASSVSAAAGLRLLATVDATEEAVLPIVRLRLRIVTVDGTAAAALLLWMELRGEARGGVATGAGSLERADWTRASRRAICAVRERICVRELEAGILWLVARVGFVAVGRGAGVRSAAVPVVAARAPGPRVDDMDVLKFLGLGVMLWSADGRRDLRVVGAGVFTAFFLGNGADASDMGGEGGSWTSDAVSAVPTDLVSGGVRISGELAVELGERSKVGDSGMVISVEMVER
jgi:hypothetical protein